MFPVSRATRGLKAILTRKYAAHISKNPRIKCGEPARLRRFSTSHGAANATRDKWRLRDFVIGGSSGAAQYPGTREQAYRPAPAIDSHCRKQWPRQTAA
jgi:hypothetical protein